jgi:hypothetical protein
MNRKMIGEAIYIKVSDRKLYWASENSVTSRPGGD